MDSRESFSFVQRDRLKCYHLHKLPVLSRDRNALALDGLIFLNCPAQARGAVPYTFRPVSTVSMGHPPARESGSSGQMTEQASSGALSSPGLGAGNASKSRGIRLWTCSETRQTRSGISGRSAVLCGEH